MSAKRREYVLGRDVTEQAKAKEGRGTVVVSLRISGAELDTLSDVAVSEGKTISQVAREAIRAWLGTRDYETNWATLSFPEGPTVSFGDVQHLTFPTGDSEVLIKT